MSHNNKSFLYLSILAVFMLVLNGCGKESTDQESNKNGKIAIYTTLYPLHDFAGKIAGDRAVVENIVPPGVEPHDFEPSVKDMRMLNEADLLIYNGAGFEAWVEKTASALNNKKLRVVEASKNIDLLHEQKETSHKEDEHDHHGGYDPHIWLDPNRAKLQAKAIKEALAEIDPEHRDIYEANYQHLVQQFDGLDVSLKDLRDHVQKTEVVVSHSSFGYLTNTYGLEQISIAGLSPSDEPTQRDLQEIIETIKERQVKYIFFETLVSGKIAEVVKNEVGAEALTLNPLENLTQEEIAQGKDYFSIMKDNIEVLRKALEYQE